MSILSRLKESRIGKFWLKHNEKITLAIGIILIAAVSFEAGYLQGGKNKKDDSVVVNKAACAPCPKTSELENADEAKANSGTNSRSLQGTNENSSAPASEDQKCAFIASKNSNKYHLPTCQFAQKIKPENRVCFSSKEEAESKGYVGAKCCIK